MIFENFVKGKVWTNRLKLLTTWEWFSTIKVPTQK